MTGKMKITSVASVEKGKIRRSGKEGSLFVVNAP